MNLSASILRSLAVALCASPLASAQDIPPLTALTKLVAESAHQEVDAFLTRTPEAVATVRAPGVARRGDLKMLKILKKHGADLNQLGYGGATCLHEAARANRADILEFLLVSGADSSRLIWRHGNTVLHVAAEQKSAKAIRLLVQRRRQLINQRNYLGQTPLALFLQAKPAQDFRKDLALIRLLASKANDKPDEFGVSIIELGQTLELKAVLRALGYQEESTITPEGLEALLCDETRQKIVRLTAAELLSERYKPAAREIFERAHEKCGDDLFDWMIRGDLELPDAEPEPAEPAVTVGYMPWDNTEYWDLNADDRVDLEFHETGVQDGGLARWYRIDYDYDGFYDEEIRIGGSFVSGWVHNTKLRKPVNPIRKLEKIRISPSRVRELREAR